MAIDLSKFSAGASAVSQLSGLILVTPKFRGYQAQGQNGILDKALIFDIEANAAMNLSSDITDHVVEDNTVRNDQISIKPEVYTVNGFIGEVKQVEDERLAPLREAVEKLTLVQAYVPELTIGALRVYNAARQALQLSNQIESQFKNQFESPQRLDGETEAEFQSRKIQNNQQFFYQKLYGYWRSKSLFTIQTPWVIMDNMAIQTLKAVQDPDTRFITDFELTFKKIRFARTEFTSQAELSGRATSQASPISNNGINATSLA